MSTRKRPMWRTMFLIGFAGVGTLVIEPQLPVGATIHTLLLLTWLASFYGALAIWAHGNSEALESEPRPRDFVGRPIFDADAPEREANPRQQPEIPAVQLPVARQITQSSEVI